jgi:hypothetical protein
MDFWAKCSSAEGMSICMSGLLMGIVLTLLLVWVYLNVVSPRMKAERFVDPNALDPQSAALLQMHNAADPTSAYMARKMYGSSA